MKITLRESGGFAPGVRRPSRVIDSEDLTPEAAAELTRLLAEAQNAPERGVETGRARDTMSFTVSVDEAGRSPIVLHQSDANMTEAFAALVDWLANVKDE